MTREIHYIATRLREIRFVYGFGSAFRSANYNDVDLLVVFEADNSGAFSDYLVFLKKVSGLSKSFGISIDVTALTVSEAATAPLRESDRLVPLYERRDFDR